MAEEWSRSSLLSLPGVLLPLVWITIFTRLYIKRCILKLVTMDDWVMVIAATLFTANCALYIIMSLSGWAEHQDTLAENQVAFVLEVRLLCFHEDMRTDLRTVILRKRIALHSMHASRQV